MRRFVAPPLARAQASVQLDYLDYLWQWRCDARGVGPDRGQAPSVDHLSLCPTSGAILARSSSASRSSNRNRDGSRSRIHNNNSSSSSSSAGSSR